MTTDYLLHEELERVLGCLTPTNRVICKFLVSTGLRIGDALALGSGQIKRQFWITEQKTGKRRRVNLSDSLIGEIRQLANGSKWAFPGRFGDKPQTRQAVYQDIKRAARAYRLPQNVAPHSLRKVYAVDLLNKYGDIVRVQRALNHSGLAVTLLYAMADKRLESKLGIDKRRKP